MKTYVLFFSLASLLVGNVSAPPRVPQTLQNWVNRWSAGSTIGDTLHDEVITNIDTLYKFGGKLVWLKNNDKRDGLLFGYLNPCLQLTKENQVGYYFQPLVASDEGDWELLLSNDLLKVANYSIKPPSTFDFEKVRGQLENGARIAYMKQKAAFEKLPQAAPTFKITAMDPQEIAGYKAE